MFLATALSVGVWLLYRAQESIAALTSISHDQPKLDTQLDTRFALTSGAALLVDSFYGGNTSLLALVAPALSATLLAKLIYLRAQAFARHDRKRKPRPSTYIYSANSETRSGWANNPALLDALPSWIDSRMLTCATLIEVGALLIGSYCWPWLGGWFLAMTMATHYCTDALDGALGRHRGEGYVQWGYYTDHCFDAVYELACMLALVPLIEDALLTSTLIALMPALVWLFHARELVLFGERSRHAYSNTVGPFPLHYLEWSSILLALAAQLLGFDWYWVGLGTLASLLAGSALLVHWHWQALGRTSVLRPL